VTTPVRPERWDYSPPFLSGDQLLTGWQTVTRVGTGQQVLNGASEVRDAATGSVTSHPLPSRGVTSGLRGDAIVGTLGRTYLASPFPVEVVVERGVVVVGSLADQDARRQFATGGGSRPTLGRDAVFQAGDGPLATTPAGTASGRGVRAFSLTTPRPGCAGNLECPLWATPVDGLGTDPVISPDQSTLYVGTDAGTVYALDAATGAVRWTASVGFAIRAAPALAAGTLYVPTWDGVVAFPAGGCGSATCTALWKGVTGSPVTVQPGVGGGLVFTGTAGPVHAFAAAGCGAASCDPLWSDDPGRGYAISGAPAVDGGHVYVGTFDGRIVGYALP
jgi:outer membrane protein assembly factor BamB